MYALPVIYNASNVTHFNSFVVVIVVVLLQLLLIFFFFKSLEPYSSKGFTLPIFWKVGRSTSILKLAYCPLV